MADVLVLEDELIGTVVIEHDREDKLIDVDCQPTAMLVLKEVPKNCYYCPVGIRIEHSEDYIYCPPAHQGVMDVEIWDRPEWCPLQISPGIEQNLQEFSERIEECSRVVAQPDLLENSE